MAEEILIRQGAPTLAGIKTGSLFPCPCEDREVLLSDIRKLNRRLSPKGLCLLPIRFLAGQALLDSIARCAAAGSAGRAGIRAAAAGGLRRRGKSALTIQGIQKMHGDLLHTLAKRLEAGATCRCSLII